MKLKTIVILIILVAGIFSSGLQAQTIQKDTVTILSFNDFHGAFISGTDIPGADNFMTTLLNAKNSMPNPIILSGGDNFSGSYYSLMSKGEPHQVFTLPVSPNKIVSAVGNHEFDWGTDFLLGTSCKYINYVGANLTRLKDNKTFKDTIPDYRIINIRNGRDTLKIGIIGISTPTTPFGGKRPFVDEFAFDAKFSSKVSSIATSLKTKDKVDLVVLLMHIGTCMKDGKPAIDDTDKTSAEELRQIDYVDAIVSAHSHKLVRGGFAIANGSKTIPIIQAATNGSHIGMLQFELSDKRVRFIKDSLIAVPVPNWKIKQMVDSISSAGGFEQTIVRSKKNLVHDRNINLHEFTEVGAIVTASYLNQYSKSQNADNSPASKDAPGKTERPVIAVHHFKGIRTGIAEGELSRSQVGNILPFGGNLAAYEMTGSEVRKLFETGMDTTQSRGRLQTCNMKFKLSDQKIIGMQWFDGESYIDITDTMECIVLCDDFIAYGGDGYDTHLFKTKIAEFCGYVTTDCLIQYLKECKVVPNNRYKIPEIMKESAVMEEGGKSTIKGWEVIDGGNVEVTM
ncbi:MAG: 5'-nucleotidase C-terminal domain-containing protein [Bacteroides sp.]